MGKKLNTNKRFAELRIALLRALLATLLSEILVRLQLLFQSVYVIKQSASLESSLPLTKAEEPIDSFLEREDVEEGKKLVRKCFQYHTVDQNGPHRVGTQLLGIAGGSKARFPGFRYSEAAKNQKGFWDRAALNLFLKNPRECMPGTKMVSPGLKKIVDRANLIAYLETLRR